VKRELNTALLVALPFLSAAPVPADAAPQTAEDRKARIRELVAQEQGEITALEPSRTGDGSVLVGYSSGAVLRCDDEGRCTEYAGTPNIPVEGIAASPLAGSEVVWVAYGQGALYRCVDSQYQKTVKEP
jgi:hypothetical protein